MPAVEVTAKAKSAAMKALELDDTLAEAHTSLAYAKHSFDWDWEGAEACFRRAIELNPNYANAHHWFAHLLIATGRMDESGSALRTQDSGLRTQDSGLRTPPPRGRVGRAIAATAVGGERATHPPGVLARFLPAQRHRPRRPKVGVPGNAAAGLER